MNASTTPRFFMSYPRENKSIAVGLMSGLKSLNFDVWMDQAMAPGEDWADRIPKEIEKSHGMVLVCSKHTLRSQWCKSEVRHATQVGLPVWIVRSESMEPPSWMKFCAGGRNYIDLYRGTISQAASDIAESFHNIEDSVQTKTGTAKSDEARRAAFMLPAVHFEAPILVTCQITVVVFAIYNLLWALEVVSRPKFFIYIMATVLFNAWLGIRYLASSKFSIFDQTFSGCALLTWIPFVGGVFTVFTGWKLRDTTTLTRSSWTTSLGVAAVLTAWGPLMSMFPEEAWKIGRWVSAALGIISSAAIFNVVLHTKLLDEPSSAM